MAGRRGVWVLACLGLCLGACGPLRKHDVEDDGGGAGGTDASASDAGVIAPRVWLAWLEDLEGAGEVRLVDVEGEGPSEILASGASHLEWSPDGRWLVADRQGDASLLIAFDDDAHVTTPLSLDGQALSDCRVSWGDALLLCHRSASDALAVVDISGTTPNARAVGGGGAPYDLVGWTPNGKFAVAISIDGGDFAAFLIDAASATPSVVALSQDSPQIRFSHDSRHVAYLGASSQPGLWVRDLLTSETWLVSAVSNGGFEWLSGGPGLAHGDVNGVHVFVPSNGATLSLAPAGVASFEVAPGGTRLVYTDAAGANVLLDTTSLPAKELGTISSGQPSCWSPSDRFLALTETVQGVPGGLLLADLANLSLAPVALDTGQLQNSVLWCYFVDDTLLEFNRLGGWTFYADTQSPSPTLIPEASLSQPISWTRDRSRLAYRTIGGRLETALREPVLSPIVISDGPISDGAFRP